MVDYGEVPCDIRALAEAVRAIPAEAWQSRSDPESYETKVVREGRAGFPGDLVSAVIDAAAARYFVPGYTNRVVLSSVPAGKGILPHSDDFGDAVRKASRHCHIPVLTDERAIMGFPRAGERLHLKAGHLYALDETEPHYVVNDSPVDRIHLLFAYFPHDGIGGLK